MSGSLLREARLRAGLSQVELARRAGVTQSVVSAYEMGARQPSLPTLIRLVAASGLDLDVRVRPPADDSPPDFHRVLLERLFEQRREVRRIARRHGLSNLRVFGSVARGEETDRSDIDLLVDVPPAVGLLGLARCQRELEALLGAPVDLIPASDLKAGVAGAVLVDAVRL